MSYDLDCGYRYSQILSLHSLPAHLSHVFSAFVDMSLIPFNPVFSDLEAGLCVGFGVTILRWELQKYHLKRRGVVVEGTITEVGQTTTDGRDD